MAANQNGIDGVDPRTGGYAALMLRVILGALFIAHLYWKFAILKGGIDGWWQGLLHNGYPWFVPYYVISVEFAGALLLIPGIYPRLVALYAIPMMAGAAQFWLVRKGFFFTSAGGEMPTTWTLLLIAQVLLGDGAYACIKTRLPAWVPILGQPAASPGLS